VQEADSARYTFEAFTLLGILANYNKFEHRNPYGLRLEDFVNETLVGKIVLDCGKVCSDMTAKYVDIINDIPDTTWTLASTLTYIGLGVLAPIKAINPVAAAPEEEHEKFAVL
jgi:hypothetical protein